MNRNGLLPFNRPQVEAIILEYIQLLLSDNVKARKLDKNLQNNYYKGNSDFPLRSHVETYYMVKRKLEGLGKEDS
jgi:polyphosphate kinase